MPQSLVKILVHIVFSTKNRSNWILPEKEKDLYSYISGVVEGNKAKLIIANGTMNHSHFLVSLGRNDVSELIGDMKRDSSSWEKRTRYLMISIGSGDMVHFRSANRRFLR